MDAFKEKGVGMECQIAVEINPQDPALTCVSRNINTAAPPTTNQALIGKFIQTPDDRCLAGIELLHQGAYGRELFT